MVHVLAISLVCRQLSYGQCLLQYIRFEDDRNYSHLRLQTSWNRFSVASVLHARVSHTFSPSLAFRFQPHSRPLVWLFARTLMRKNIPNLASKFMLEHSIKKIWLKKWQTLDLFQDFLFCNLSHDGITWKNGENSNAIRSLFLRGCLHGGDEDPSTMKILEGATTFRWAYMHKWHKFRSVWLTVEKELKIIKDYPLNDRRYFCSVCPKAGIFLAKADNMVLGSS